MPFLHYLPILFDLFTIVSCGSVALLVSRTSTFGAIPNGIKPPVIPLDKAGGLVF